jgi:hypothetical protein
MVGRECVWPRCEKEVRDKEFFLWIAEWRRGDVSPSRWLGE